MLWLQSIKEKEARRPELEKEVEKQRETYSDSRSMGFPGRSDSKEFTCSAGDLGSVPGLGRAPGGGHGNPLQCSCLENPHGQRSLAGCKSMELQSQRGLRDFSVLLLTREDPHVLSLWVYNSLHLS